LKIYWKVVYL